MAGDSLTSVVKLLSELQLLSPAQMDQFTPPLRARFANGQALARELVQRGWLTAYQAKQLVLGHTKDLVLGAYHLLEPLGEGGMGRVFKARHVRLERIVALKIIHKARLASPVALERFNREARAAAQLSHPNIVLAHDAGQVGDTHFFAMEYIEGTDLSQRVKQSGRLPIAQACDYIRQAALGLQHAYERGVVHRDIKPGNLVVTEANGKGPPVIKILDFGMARFASEPSQTGNLTQLGQFLGTIDYISPEQAENPRKADTRTDIYSLGCTLFYLLTARPPFLGEDVVQRLSARLLEDAPSVTTLRPAVPPGLDRDPAQRYQTPAEVAAALELFAKVRGRPAAPSPVPARSTDSQKRSQSASSPSQRKDGQGPLTRGKESVPTAGRNARPRGPGEPAPSRKARLLILVVGISAMLLVAVILMALMIPGPGGKPVPGPPSPDLDPPIPVVEGGANLAIPVLAASTVGLMGSPQGQGPLLAASALILERANVALSVLVARSVGLMGFPQGQGPLLAASALIPERDKIVPAAALSQDADEVPVGEIRCFKGHESPVYSVGFSPDGRRALSGGGSHEPGSDCDLRLWDVETGQELRRLKGHKREVFSIAFFPDGRRALSGSFDGTVRLWDVERGQELHSFQHAGGVWTVAIAPDGRSALSGSRDTNVYRWDVRNLKEDARFKIHENGIQSVAWSRDGKYALSAGGERWDEAKKNTVAGSDLNLRLWEVATGEVQQTFKGHQDMVFSVALSADGRYALSGSADGNMRLWDRQTGTELRRFGERINGGGFWGYGVAFSPDSRRALSGSFDGKVRLWDVESGKELWRFEGHTHIVGCVIFSADGRRALSGSFDKTVRLWKLPEQASQPVSKQRNKVP